jgi:hypothetical protein
MCDTRESLPSHILAPQATPAGFSDDARTRAREARRAATKARAESTLRRDFLEESHWLELASHYGLRLPPWGMPCTPGQMARWLRKVGLSGKWYREWTGFGSLQDWIIANPLWPLRAFAGLLLEECESEDWHKAEESCSTT